MKKGFAVTGVPTPEELANNPGSPSIERLKEGGVAVIECMQEIPCNPCEVACPYGAITVGDPITNVPVLDEEKCTGCGVCLPACPGLAIFLINLTHSDTKALVAFPYELLPLPEKGRWVEAVNREGRVVTRGRVVLVPNPPSYDRTPIVYIAVPKEFAHEVRGIKPLGGE